MALIPLSFFLHMSPRDQKYKRLNSRVDTVPPPSPCMQQIGRIHVAAFSDELLYNEVLGKAYFWVQQSFYGVDVTPLYEPAVDSYFAQVGQ